MLLIAEILLTIWAWRKGWRSKALIPVCSAIGIGIIVGCILISSGATISIYLSIFDVMAIIALSIMINKPPKKEYTPIKDGVLSKVRYLYHCTEGYKYPTFNGTLVNSEDTIKNTSEDSASSKS